MIELPDLNRLHELFEYHPDDGWLRRKVSTRGHAKGAKVGCIWRKGGEAYITTRVDGVQYHVHRLIWFMQVGKIPDGMQIDHVNHDGTDNRLENLRIVSPRGNSRNTRLRSANKTGVSGVRKTSSGRYDARIRGNGGKRIHLGTYDTLDKAKAVREAAERRYGYHVNHGATF